MARKRLLYITVRSDFGGGPKHVDQLIQGLGMDHDVYLASPLGEPFGNKWAENTLIKDFFKLPFRRLSFYYLFGLVRFIVRNNIKIIHSHGNGAGFYSRLVKLVLPNVIVIHTFHGISDNYKSSIKRELNSFIGQLFSHLTDWFVFVSNGEMNLGITMKFAKRGNCSVIYNGIITPSYYAKDIKEEWSDFKILSLSRFDYQKNMNKAFEVAKRLIAYSRIKFVWVGDGPDYEILRRRAVEERVGNIDFVGFSNTPENYLAHSHLYFSISRFEGLPYGLIEAASHGLPIVASNVRGNNEVAINNYNGLLFETEDEAVNHILKFYRDKDFYNKCSKQSMSFFFENFTIEKMLDKVSKLYRKF